MLRKSLFTLAMSGAILVGCGDDSTDNTTTDGAVLHDASVVDSTVHDSSAADASSDAGSGLLQSGLYALSNIVKKSDGCGLTLEDGTQPPIQLTNTGTTISLGTSYNSTTTPAWNPAGYALGSGPYSTPTTANLTVLSTTVTDGACTYTVARTVNLTYKGVNNTIDVDYTDNESNFSSGCKASDGYPTGPCTSEYTFTLTKSN